MEAAIGAIFLSATGAGNDAAPFLPCDGRLIPIQGCEGLFNVIRNRFWASGPLPVGQVNVQLPNLVGAFTDTGTKPAGRNLLHHPERQGPGPCLRSAGAAADRGALPDRANASLQRFAPAVRSVTRPCVLHASPRLAGVAQADRHRGPRINRPTRFGCTPTARTAPSD